MIYGIGVDIIEISRFNNIMLNEPLLRKIYTEYEIRYLQSKNNSYAQSAAGIFCAKEALVKSIGSGLSGIIGLSDIQVMHDEYGRPIFSGITGFEKYIFHLSISHCREYATAYVICENLE